MLMKRFDKDEDGQLAKDEVPERLWQRLSRADADKDDALTKDELEKARPKRPGPQGEAGPRGTFGRRPWGRGPQGPGGPGWGGPARGPGGSGGPGLDMLMKRFDKNEDGQLAKDEVPELLWQRMGRADADGDGALTKEELEKARPDRPGPGRRPDTEGDTGTL
jgi:hypothetical protein